MLPPRGKHIGANQQRAATEQRAILLPRGSWSFCCSTAAAFCRQVAGVGMLPQSCWLTSAVVRHPDSPRSSRSFAAAAECLAATAPQLLRGQGITAFCRHNPLAFATEMQQVFASAKSWLD